MILKHQEKSIYITNKLGLHARAAAKFVKITSKIESKVVVKKGDNIVNGSSILGLMTLAATKGSQITIRCSGKNPDEDLPAWKPSSSKSSRPTKTVATSRRNLGVFKANFFRKF